MVILWANIVILWANMVVLWYLVKKTKGVIKCGDRTPVLTQHLKRWGRGVFGENTVVLWATMVIFGANIVVFRANMLIFWGNYCGIWF